MDAIDAMEIALIARAWHLEQAMDGIIGHLIGLVIGDLYNQCPAGRRHGLYGCTAVVVQMLDASRVVVGVNSLAFYQLRLLIMRQTLLSYLQRLSIRTQHHGGLWGSDRTRGHFALSCSRHSLAGSWRRWRWSIGSILLRTDLQAPEWSMPAPRAPKELLLCACKHYIVPILCPSECARIQRILVAAIRKRSSVAKLNKMNIDFIIACALRMLLHV